MFALLLVSLALAAEDSTSEATPAFPAEIMYVPSGSTLTISGKKYHTQGKTWLFPESHYTSAITKAQKLEICEPALIKLREDYSLLLTNTDREVSSCTLLLEESHKREAELTSKALLLEKQNIELTVKVSSARKSALMAWSITGALLLGAGTAVYLTLP